VFLKTEKRSFLAVFLIKYRKIAWSGKRYICQAFLGKGGSNNPPWAGKFHTPDLLSEAQAL
jgi:hypothetical protein